ncbi:6235_t:CDS:2 [Dentiscutata erythropus]|uniref:6235_t:CDS:1 n=1 Tax=Dentiscutata erythropus TaxID=1348616 RepID=A0A9N9JJM1_9GLOM|nr:6235_t:CDS:2 [Dentiscutata erythropus]
MTYKAIIFDMGGVCVGSPFEGIMRFEKEHNLPHNYINVIIVKNGENGAFQRLERGELPLNEFYKIFSKELSNPLNKQIYIKYLKLRGETTIPQIPDQISIDGKSLFREMMSESTKIDPIVFTALKKLRSSNKFKLAALTNNFLTPADVGGTIPQELKCLFDEVFESSVIGLRKPDPKIFLYACEKLGIEPKDAIFLDDIGMNLKPAMNLGMRTIKVELGKSEKAIKELEQLTGISLFDNEMTNKTKL